MAEKYVIGSRPVHVHHSPDNEWPDWKCNSPYCEDLTTPPPDQGGPEPVIQGREPWRGR